MSDEILERRKRLLQQRMNERDVAAPATPARREHEPSPLSGAQRRMWFLQRLDPADTTLNICVAYRLDGELDPARLRAALGTVVERHEILRTTYHVDDSGEPYQLSRRDTELSWQEHDLCELPAGGRERRLEVLARREFARPFDLTADAPLRAMLVRTGAAEHVLVLTVHHIGWDDDSWPVFFAEVNAAYRGEGLPPIGAQYVDVDAARPGSAADDADLAFWRDALTPLPSRLELPGRLPVGAHAGTTDTCVRPLTPAQLSRISDIARAHSATDFMVLLAAFEALVHRYTAAGDFLIAVPVTNRAGRGADKLIGYFGNTVLLRAAVGRDESFASLVESTRDACIGAFSHQGVGIDRVISAVGPDRAAGRDGMAQLVQLSFAMRGAVNSFDLPGVDAVEVSLGGGVAQEELGLMVVNDSAGARLEATYLVDALDERVVAQFLDHYVRLLDCVLRDPGQRLRTIDILGAGRAELVARSRGKVVERPPVTLTTVLEEQAAASADDIAVVSDDVVLTFAELDRRANRLAHWLIGRGVGAEDIVALRLATSVEFIVGTWAVLKSGAAYLPIDPAYPAERIEYLLGDAEPRIELDEAGFAAAETAAATLSETNPSDADRISPLRPQNIAYVIYTSGSTGRPKGVPVPHAAIAELVSGIIAQCGFTAEDRVLQSTSVSFDASLIDIFVTLAAGARVVVPKPNAYRDIPYVTELVVRHGVTVLHMVPSMLATFLMVPEVKDWTTLRWVPVGGEALPGEVADRFAALFEADLSNHYGPTEAVVCSTSMAVTGPQGAGIVPIGPPNHDVHLYLLDGSLQLVPDGVVGEIYLGGNQVARGYLNRAALTAERFVADPFRPGGRLYRTGDLARRGADGVVEFIGRADEQVKVRGHRIELGEVEASLTDHPDIAHSVVVVAEHESLGQTLVAYVVPAAGAEPDPDALRSHLASRLPDYMVPAAITPIAEIPLTTHGKLDKRALPAPAMAVDRAFREPRTPTERKVAALYANLFDGRRIGADDSFFELGGHSLLAARLISMIRAEFGIEIDMRVPFDTPTVTGLAGYLADRFRDEFGIDIDDLGGDDAQAGAAEPSAAADKGRPDLIKRERPQHIPLSYAQRMYWLQRRMEGWINGENVAYPVRFDGPLDIDALRAAITDVAARHESLRTTFPEHEGEPYQYIHPAGPVPLPITDLTGLPDAQERVDRELAQEEAYVFDLEHEPLLRVRLFVLDERTHVLSFLTHHIIADRRSCHIFVDDLSTAYRARIDGAAPALPELGIQFADFAMWQRDIFDRSPGRREISAYGQELLDYWCDTLAGMPDEIAVAHDRPRPQVLGHGGVSTTRVIPAETWSAAKTFAEQAGATDFMLCQAMCAVTLHALGAGDDLPIGAAVANRLDEITDDMIGLFANMVVLRNDLSGNPTLQAILRRVRDFSLDAITRQGVPFDRLVETINPRRSLSRNPLFQVVMHFRNRLRPTDFTADGATTVTSIAKFYEVSFMDFHFDYTVELDGSLTTRVVLNTDLYEPASGEVFADVLVRVIEAFAEDPERAVGELELLSEGWDTGRSVVRPAAAAPAPAGEIAAAPPRTETERTIATLLGELLEIDEIGRHNGFFELGGDSIVAIQLAARAGEAGLPLTPQMMFEHFTIADLGAAVDEIIANPPAESANSAAADQRVEPMAASGLDAETLAGLGAAWAARR
ncbi:amino acid adenylation domain-containing protein [Nocardia thraciensis]